MVWHIELPRLFKLVVCRRRSVQLVNINVKYNCQILINKISPELCQQDLRRDVCIFGITFCWIRLHVLRCRRVIKTLRYTEGATLRRGRAKIIGDYLELGCTNFEF